MKKSLLVLPLILATAGCVGNNQGALTGAALGAATGAAVSGSDDRAAGALIGGALGAAAGNYIGRASSPGMCVYQDPTTGRQYTAAC
ncbi:glycine zipper 2TM domain-containing protein [Palleronia sediminis]|uniref:17 kDa surface antigen n=1 Tax=Palleronia sediminis TaxID=2547833 RepID=A0A4R5ZVX2_9RHOB|nr:glycine zipper domain-containing protein [Palleronia sediminis]TDL75210.1 glycine zipper 2TM domain-containing protein [Palleronia sediminis]